MKRNSTPLRAWLTLIRTPGLGGNRLRALIGRYGDAEAALEAVRADPGPSLGVVGRAWLRSPDDTRLDADEAWLDHRDHRLICFDDDDYPPLLAESVHGPAALFVVGDPAHLLVPQVAIVGARAASAGGRANARAFAGGLARAGLVVTSGLADGVDGAAHAAALDAGVPTVAVTGTGLDRVYPSRHRDLAARIAAGGALVSEFPPGVGARPEHFPRRNRIIAALALGTLVIEAGTRSGSLITARLAAEYGREVFALPGSIHHPLSRGCHSLIRDGARLVEQVDDVVEALTPLAQALGTALARRLGQSASATPYAEDADHFADDPDYVRLLGALGYDPLPLEVLIERTGLEAATLSSMLLMLELEQRVASLPGGRYQRLSQVTSTNVSA